jgi:copper chaperone
VAVYLAITAVSAIGFGLLLDGIIGWFSLPMPDILGDTMAHGTNWLQIVTGVIFGAVLIRSLVMRVVRKIRAKRDKVKENITVLDIDGMSCEHCAKTVREALGKVDGVVSVSVDVKEGKAYVQGEDIDIEILKKTVTDAGYEVK